MHRMTEVKIDTRTGNLFLQVLIGEKLELIPLTNWLISHETPYN